jgi:2-polyprenyl-6-methoxyphenol hydroxylase-like FAD-dependent oxidoreductase
MNVLIIGGGVAGPALGVALARAGIPAQIVEARPADQSVTGAFLALAPNGVNALDTIGLPGLVAEAGGVPVPEIRFYNATGREIGLLDAHRDTATYGAEPYLLRRGALCDALLRAARRAGVRVTFGRRLTGLQESATEVLASFDDGSTIAADVVLGCDGVRSAVRRLALSGAPEARYTGVLDCGGWTGVANLADTGGQRMYWGRRAFFGYVAHAGTAYWFSNVAQAREPARGELDSDAWLMRVRTLHADDPDPVPRILAVADSVIGVWPVCDLDDLPTWRTARVCLLGDAAHAASPSAGQGASLALEDAAAMARCLRDIDEPAVAFATFSRLRKARAEKVVAMGRRIGDRKIPSARQAWVRDRLLPLFLRMGAGQAREQYRYRIDWDETVRPVAAPAVR